MYMKTVTMAQLRNHLAQHLDEVSGEHEIITVTRNGAPEAVLVAADEWESIEETLFWSQPENAAGVAAATAELDRGEGVPFAEVYRQLAAQHDWDERGSQL